MDLQVVPSAVSCFKRQSALLDAPQQGTRLAGVGLPGHCQGCPPGCLRSASQARHVCSERAFSRRLIRVSSLPGIAAETLAFSALITSKGGRKIRSLLLPPAATLATLILASKVRVIVRFRVQIPVGLPAGTVAVLME